MKYKAILFDMDGVLVLSEPVHYQAWVHVIREIDADIILREEDIIGITDLSLAKEILKHSDNYLNENELCLKKKNYFLELLKKGLPVVDGRDFFLKMNRKNSMAVVSSSTREEIAAVLDAGKISKYFDFFVGYEDTILHKPDPEPYLKSMDLLDCKPTETLIIEDSPTGVEAAINSGADVLGINSSGLLDQSLGIKICKDFHEIAEWLDFGLNGGVRDEE